MPDIISFGAVMDEDEETKSDGEGTIQATEDHVQEVALGHGQCPKRPRGQEQEKCKGCCSQLRLEGVLISQQRGVDGDARAAGGAVAPDLRGCRGSRLGSLVAVGGHIDGRQSLLLLCQLLELVLLFRVSP